MDPESRSEQMSPASPPSPSSASPTSPISVSAPATASIPAQTTAPTRTPASAPVSTAESEPEAVLVRVPADPDYLAVIRSASAHVATKFGCTLSEVADLRLAVDEACGLLLRHTVGDGREPGAGDLECRFVLEQSVLRVVLSRQAHGVARPEDDDFGWTILSALVDDIVWRADGPTVYVELLKHRTSGS